MDGTGGGGASGSGGVAYLLVEGLLGSEQLLVLVDEDEESDATALKRVMAGYGFLQGQPRRRCRCSRGA